MAVETVTCSECGQERPDRGRCPLCRSGLCSICKAVIPASRKDHRCKDCKAGMTRKWRKSNPDKEKQSIKRWREANKDRALETSRRWKQKNESEQREYNRKWNQENRESVSKRMNEWHSEHPMKRSEYARRWREANPQKKSDEGRAWRKANPEKRREKERRRRARLKGCQVSFADISAVVERSGGLCALCRACVPEQFRHIDHIIPLDKGGAHTQENLQVLCYRCNSRKGNKDPDEVKPETWTKQADPSQPFLFNPNWR